MSTLYGLKFWHKFCKTCENMITICSDFRKFWVDVSENLEKIYLTVGKF